MCVKSNPVLDKYRLTMSLSLPSSFTCIILDTHAAFKDNTFDSISIKPIPPLLWLLIKTFFSTVL